MNKKFLYSVGLFFLLVGCATDTYRSNNNVAKLIRLAQKARETGNPEASINFYDQAKKIDGKNAKIYLGLSEVYIDIKLLDAATEYLKKAEEYNANKDQLNYLRGKIYLLTNEIDKAEAEFKKSTSVDCLNALGAVYDSRQNHEAAQRLYKMAIAKDPKYIDAYNNLGLSLLLSDKYKDAVFYLEGACALPGANATYRANLALAYGLMGNISKARQIYAQDFEGEELNEKVAYIEDVVAAKNKAGGK
ncbi:MAG: tetratricopeptide repeat protein [Alphaproteobacteria bacterium]|nr:tetratricopeptide repeat protein [Alphaproteobacteria bacterium]